MTRSFHEKFQTHWLAIHRVNQQCCPGGNCPETLRGGLRGSPDILGKSLANPDKIFQKTSVPVCFHEKNQTRSRAIYILTLLNFRFRSSSTATPPRPSWKAWLP